MARGPLLSSARRHQRPKGSRIHLRMRNGMYLCRVCQIRYARARMDDCCMQCAVPVDAKPPEIVKPEWQQPRPPIPRVIEGVEYFVMWDGS